MGSGRVNSGHDRETCPLHLKSREESIFEVYFTLRARLRGASAHPHPKHILTAQNSSAKRRRRASWAVASAPRAAKTEEARQELRPAMYSHAVACGATVEAHKGEKVYRRAGRKGFSSLQASMMAGRDSCAAVQAGRAKAYRIMSPGPTLESHLNGKTPERACEVLAAFGHRSFVMLLRQGRPSGEFERGAQRA